MPGNWGYLGDDTKKYLCNNFDRSCKILDVGCGHGFYYKLLSDYFINFDAVEVWSPYIQEYNLEKMYDNVYNVNIMDFEFEFYDIIIMVDVLEHLERSDVIKLLNRIKDKCKELLVIVPYYLPQDDVYLVGTAEQSIGTMHAEETFKEKELPKRYMALKKSIEEGKAKAKSKRNR